MSSVESVKQTNFQDFQKVPKDVVQIVPVYRSGPLVTIHFFYFLTVNTEEGKLDNLGKY